MTSFIAGALIATAGTIVVSTVIVNIWLTTTDRDDARWHSQYEPPNEGPPE